MPDNELPEEETLETEMQSHACDICGAQFEKEVDAIACEENHKTIPNATTLTADCLSRITILAKENRYKNLMTLRKSIDLFLDSAMDALNEAGK